jgi:hypothetical protein
MVVTRTGTGVLRSAAEMRATTLFDGCRLLLAACMPACCCCVAAAACCAGGGLLRRLQSPTAPAAAACCAVRRHEVRHSRKGIVRGNRGKVDVKKVTTIVPCPFRSSFTLHPRLFLLPPCGRRGQTRVRSSSQSDLILTRTNTCVCGLICITHTAHTPEGRTIAKGPLRSARRAGLTTSAKPKGFIGHWRRHRDLMSRSCRSPASLGLARATTRSRAPGNRPGKLRVKTGKPSLQRPATRTPLRAR